MSISPLSILAHRFFCFLLVLLIASTTAYIIDSDDLGNSHADQLLGMHVPLYYDRLVRTTKFPRIGRSLADIDDLSLFGEPNALSNSEENELSNDDNESRWFEQRSVHFPRIGKRAFHNLLWANSLANPHRTLDAQGRYHLNGYDYRVHANPSPSIAAYRGKRSLSM